jgi:hypothetical protein
MCFTIGSVGHAPTVTANDGSVGKRTDDTADLNVAKEGRPRVVRALLNQKALIGQSEGRPHSFIHPGSSGEK